jgi:hypothetical protein
MQSSLSLLQVIQNDFDNRILFNGVTKKILLNSQQLYKLLVYMDLDRQCFNVIKRDSNTYEVGISDADLCSKCEIYDNNKRYTFYLCGKHWFDVDK